MSVPPAKPRHLYLLIIIFLRLIQKLTLLVSLKSDYRLPIHRLRVHILQWGRKHHWMGRMSSDKPGCAHHGDLRNYGLLSAH